MRTRASRPLLVFIATGLATGRLLAWDAIALDQLPGAVQNALAKKFPGTHATKAEREERNDYIWFLVTLKGAKSETRIKINENGEVSTDLR